MWRKASWRVFLENLRNIHYIVYMYAVDVSSCIHLVGVGVLETHEEMRGAVV
jgi:hypothetical protein